MQKFILFISFLALSRPLLAQDKKIIAQKEPVKNDLPALRKCIITAQENLPLFTQNLNDHSREHDMNSLVLDIEKYIDSMHKTKSYSDALLLMKHFAPLRHFFLTTANKTTVAAAFLYPDAPYHFCLYNDSALTLYIGAVKDGEIYNLSKMTEKRITKVAFENCLLPTLKALDEFKGDEIKYIALTVYYGCKDTREGAPAVPAVAYCLTFINRMADVQQYAAGLLTVKGLVANAEIYTGDTEDPANMRRIQINIE